MKKAITLTVVIFSVGFALGFYSWAQYYDAYIRPEKLSVLKDKELQRVIYTMVEKQPFDVVAKEIGRAFPVELPWMHVLGHFMGEQAYRRYGYKALAMCDMSYNHGCYHGVVQIIARLHGPGASYLRDLYEACVASKSSANCSDPLGHAATTLANYDMQKALKLCDEYFPVPNEALHCGLGAFMELFNEPKAGTFAPGSSKQELQHVCDGYPTIYKAACVDLSLSYLVNLFGYTVDDLIVHCNQFDENDVIWRCMYSVGAIASEQHVYGGVEPVPVCLRLGQYYDPCMVGILRTYQSTNQVWRIPKLCPLMKGDEAKDACVAVLREQSASL